MVKDYNAWQKLVQVSIQQEKERFEREYKEKWKYDMLEDAAVIYRLTQSPERKAQVYKVDVGNLPVEQYVNELKEKLINGNIDRLSVKLVKKQKPNASWVLKFDDDV